ncbi:phenylacetic acid degradation bifunctional protein PaaZ [Rhodoplanes sp. TEM]|uniref:Phenylacetic acid degradation bifunctional protein PaaZ n=1 Tax=Rhodoplanes tepidamans TaxID=200616 RepID=A0ABT5JFC6_RHOTP|nr:MULTISPECIES: phenylacetic acid degradation bifunctional protein PaaZ [Rhodoplanes]MDC7788322.1 phenylacetic acid degradation bifunctional protein PaaZ [Rhodoplanes tepidamans]MDC7986941.1 phenylacetic acid degradation bifunctional protein PaaZ [Rhodoplanes sp. TEM]MDQ0358803.1 oxepin-CoA hydrolase/3-oxo-5,6-dehydrosuberyl-CoA semialdehyde dehydrogenase [Rhodoplanes tepidamans]
MIATQSIPTLASFVQDGWVTPVNGLVDIPSAIDGRIVARASSDGVDFSAAVRFSREVGGPALRALTFHERADRLKALAAFLSERKEQLYTLSADTGATRRDNFFDIDGGIGTLFAYASRGRRELPAERFVIDGDTEALSRGGTFMGLHVLTPLNGVAVHINAFNFPCWGMLEKLAPTILAGVPVITKPATATAYVAEALVRLIVEADVLPKGALQLVCGSAGDLLDHLGGQDVVSFTGSADTSDRLRNHPVIGRNAVRFIAERDSLNAAVLGPDATPGTPEFELFVKEVVREMTVKTGQKCTAIRRVVVPRPLEASVVDAIGAQLDKVAVGDPRRDDVRMGPLASLTQRAAVREAVADLLAEAEIVAGDPLHATPVGGDMAAGAFMAPVLLACAEPLRARRVHTIEPFGPVATVMPYDTPEEAVAIVARGEGSLVASVFTHDDAIADALVFGLAPFHGRVLIVDRDCAKESTGHGSPLPGLVHGGPGRAGGGEEMGGLRGVFHYMQRTALQGSPARLASLTRKWMKGAPAPVAAVHPFRRDYEALSVGDTVETDSRKITIADIEHFADFTGDAFYAHMDEAAAQANPFFPGRVAHGYLILSFAAGLFVDPAPGPLLANYGLDNLRFLKPVSPGEAIKVRLTVKEKRPARKPDYGEVRWDVEVFNQDGETVARYDLLTMSARRGTTSSAAAA